jgi:hypothetical protein
MRKSEPRSPLARAVLPVLGGIAFFAVLGLFLWGVAALISRNSDRATSALAPTLFEMGGTKSIAATIEKGGPLILPDLLQANGKRTIVLNHTGDDPRENWDILMAYPADRDVNCKIVLIKNTTTFTDCEQRTLTVSDLARPPRGVAPIVQRNGSLTLDLRPDSAEPTGTPTTS